MLCAKFKDLSRRWGLTYTQSNIRLTLLKSAKTNKQFASVSSYVLLQHWPSTNNNKGRNRPDSSILGPKLKSSLFHRVLKLDRTPHAVPEPVLWFWLQSLSQIMMILKYFDMSTSLSSTWMAIACHSQIKAQHDPPMFSHPPRSHLGHVHTDEQQAVLRRSGHHRNYRQHGGHQQYVVVVDVARDFFGGEFINFSCLHFRRGERRPLQDFPRRAAQPYQRGGDAGEDPKRRQQPDRSQL